MNEERIKITKDFKGVQYHFNYLKNNLFDIEILPIEYQALFQDKNNN